jgi:hypothetical protein
MKVLLHTFLTTSLVSFLLFASPVRAQVTEGSIAGSVTDQSGAVVAKAQVVARNIATGAERTVLTDAAGLYRIGFLQPGVYRVTAKHYGFGDETAQGVKVEPSVTTRSDLHLAVGTVVATVEVTDASSLVDTEEGRLVTTLSQQQVEDLPTPGRDVYSLALLQPGVTATLAPVISDMQSNLFNFGFSANGATPRGNNFVIDGVSNNNEWLGGTPAISPSVEGIQSFQVQTANFSAEYGRNNGAIVITNTRAGTNQFHGSMYDYIRNPIFDAGNEFDQPLTGKTKIHRNDFGVSVGGPIVKDKTFLFFNYEGVREADSTTLIGLGETPQYDKRVAQYRGTTIAYTQFKLHPSGVCVPGVPYYNFGSIYDEALPLATVQANPVAAQFFDGPPETSSLGDPYIGDQCETSYLYKKPVTSNQYMTRVDHHLSATDSLFGRFIQNTNDTDTADSELNGAAARGFLAPLHGQYPSILLSEIHIFNPHLLNDLRVEYARTDFNVGFEAPNSGTATYNYPHIVLDDGTTQFGGADFVPRDFVFNNFTEADTVSIDLGRHAIKTGFEIQRLQENSNYHSDDNTYYEVQDIFTFANDSPYYQGAGVNPITGIFTGTPRHFRQTWFAAFVEDDWKATSRLAFNLGVRYDLYGVATETSGILSNVTLGSTGNTAAQITNGIVGRVPHLFNGDHNNFSPRIGFAYDVTGKGKTAIRGSISQAYLAPFSNLYTNASRFDSPDYAYTSLFPYYYGGAITYGVPGLENPAYQTGLTPQGGIAGSLIEPSGVQQKLRDAYSDQFFLGMQQALPWQYYFTANYVGTMGKKLYIRDDINRFTGDRTNNGVGAVRYNQHWASTTYVENGPGSNYNGVNFQLQHPMAKHYAFTLNYTFGKALDTVSDPGLGDYQNVAVPQYIGTMDEQHPRLDYGPSDFDARHRMTAFGSYLIPFAAANALLKNLAGGWQVNGTLSLQSGRPFSVICTSTDYCDYNGDGDGYDRPNAPSYGNTKHGLHRSDYSSLKGVVSVNDFTDPNNGNTYPEDYAMGLGATPTGKDGNLGRNTFRGPGYADVDASVFKTFDLIKMYKLQFRAEAFNLFNRVNLYLPNTTLSSCPIVPTTGYPYCALFGRSTAAFNGRNMQFALKLQY